MRIQVGDKNLAWVENRWVRMRSKPGDTWIAAEPMRKFEGQDIRHVIDTIEKEYSRDERMNMSAVNMGGSVNLFGMGDTLADGSELFSLYCVTMDAAVVLVEDVYSQDDDEPEGVLIVGLGASGGCKVGYVSKGQRAGMRRVLLANRIANTTAAYMPAWVKDAVAPDSDEVIPGLKINPGERPLLAEVLAKSAKDCKLEKLEVWLQREHAKTQRQTFVIYTGLAVGVIAWVLGFAASTIADSNLARIDAIQAELKQAQAGMSTLKTEQFLVDWMRTPSIVSAVRDVTEALADSARITELKGHVEYGRSVHIEGIAQAIRSTLKPPSVPGLKMQTVVTNGKIGIRFVLDRMAHQ